MGDVCKLGVSVLPAVAAEGLQSLTNARLYFYTDSQLPA